MKIIAVIAALLGLAGNAAAQVKFTTNMILVPPIVLTNLPTPFEAFGPPGFKQVPYVANGKKAAFWMSDHEVTQAEYQSVMGANPSFFRGKPNRPVESVTYVQARAYCDRLTSAHQSQGLIRKTSSYELPSADQWIFAARAGANDNADYYSLSHVPYILPSLLWDGIPKLNTIAWWSGNSLGQTHDVRGQIANKYGLYDMIGNVSEWLTREGSHEFVYYGYAGSNWQSVAFNCSLSYGKNVWATSWLNQMPPPSSRIGFRPILVVR